jgi:hypothetical protein
MDRLRNACPDAIVALVLIGALACDAPSNGASTTAPPPSVVAAQTSPTEPLPIAPTPHQASQEQPHGGVESTLDVSHLDDPSVAAVLQSIHERIAQQAQLAEHSARSADVKQLSHDLGTLHSDVLTTEQYLFQRLSIVPRVGAVSGQIDTDASNAIKTLRGERGSTFDRDYLEVQSRTLREAVDLFDRMYGVIQSAELKSEIARSRPDIVAGMQSVSRLQQTLNLGVANQQGR